MTVRLSASVNGRDVALDVRADETLLGLLRDRLHLTGTKDGCSEGECGACTVLVDDRAVDSCIYPAMAVAGRTVVTIEGLVGTGGALTPLQQAFVERFAVQCGFCTPGFVMMLAALLSFNAQPTEDEIRRALSGNLCRCTGYTAIVDAALYAAEMRS